MSIQHVTQYGNFVDGKEQSVEDRELLDVLNPATGEILAQTVHSTEDDVSLAVDSASAAFENDWVHMATRQRARLINKLADAFEDNISKFARLETLNNGRPVAETRAQIARLPDFLRYNAALALSRRDAVIPVDGDYLNYTISTPIGVVGNSTPFNHPLMILIKGLAPALAAGCTIVVKPSEYTPITTLELASLFVEAGLPPGVFNVVLGRGPTTGKFLAENRALAKWVLTGGTEAGKLTGAIAAGNLARQTLELGGKTPVLFFEDFDVQQAVNYAAFGAFIGSGQTCIAGSRILVQESIYDEFVGRLKKKVEGLRVGDPSDPHTQMGPLISKRQQDRVLKYIGIGLDVDHATLVTGGGVPGDERLRGGFYVEPTVFADVARDMTIFKEEVFGPFITVTPFASEMEAVELANDSVFGLAAAIRTNDVARAHRVAKRLRCGIVWVNDHHRLDPAAPWGGVKDSGIGKECGIESFNQYFDVKNIMVKLNSDPFDWYASSGAPSRLN